MVEEGFIKWRFYGKLVSIVFRNEGWSGLEGCWKEGGSLEKGLDEI